MSVLKCCLSKADATRTLASTTGSVSRKGKCLSVTVPDPSGEGDVKKVLYKNPFKQSATRLNINLDSLHHKQTSHQLFKIVSGPRRCKRGLCGRGECVLTSTPPFYQCKCKEPFQPPDCRTSKHYYFFSWKKYTLTFPFYFVVVFFLLCVCSITDTTALDDTGE